MGLERSSAIGLSMDYVQVPEEGEHAEVKAPLLMMHDRQQ